MCQTFLRFKILCVYDIIYHKYAFIMIFVIDRMVEMQLSGNRDMYFMGNENDKGFSRIF